MYVLSVRTQNELAFFRNIVGMDSVEKKEGYSSWRGTAVLDISSKVILITEHLLLSKQR